MPKNLKRIGVSCESVFTTAFLVIAGLSSSCSSENLPASPPTPVRVSAASNFQESGGIRYSANINAFTQVNLAFKSSGYVDNIAQQKGADGRVRILQLGDRVKRGEVLAHVRESDYLEKVNSAKAQLAQAQAIYDRAKLDFDRASNLFSSDSLTKSQYDAAKSSFDSNAAAVANAKADLQVAATAFNDCSLRSPLDGWVVERDVEIGALVGTGTQAFVVADTHLVKAVFGVPDITVHSARLGTSQTITTSSLPGEFHGKITAVSPSADPKSRVFSVEVTIPNADNRLKPGMVATLVLGAGKLPQIAIVVPLSAVVRSSKRTDGFAVFVVDDTGGKSIARERVVEIGDTLGNMITVTKGLQVGERVVVVGGTLIKDGDAIQVMP
ncbi:MAG: efflux RND transporter periplasmic adaptor subunit [Candidatus Acidiferrales bacterium]